MITRTATLGALAAATLLAAGTARGGPTYCSDPGAHAEGLDVSDVTFRGTSADDCFGVQSGNDLGAQGAFLGWNGFELLVSDDSGVAGGSTGSWGGVNWSLSATPNQREGSFTLRWSDPLPLNLPLTLDLLVVTKASDRFASYLFDDELFQLAPNSGAGNWEISYRNNGGQVPRISHLSIWARLQPTTRVPEPATLGLLAMGVAGIAVAVRRRAPA
jgi:hypothetical protein